MQKLIEELVVLVERGDRYEKPLAIKADLSTAPECVKQLARALAEHRYRLDFGEFSVHSKGQVNSLETPIAMAEDGEFDDLELFLESAGADGEEVVPAQTLQLGADGGGMSALGVMWSSGAPTLVVVEMDDPTEENLFTHFTQPEDFFVFVDGLNQRRKREAPDLEALRSALR